MTKASKTVSSIFKKKGSVVKLLPVPVDEKSGLPDFDKSMELMMNVYENVRNGNILAASTVKEGGAAASVCKMAFGEKTGFTFEQNLSKETLFAPLQASFVVELADGFDMEGIKLGTTTSNGLFIIDGEVITLDELISAWSEKLEKVFPTDSGKKAEIKGVPLYKERSAVSYTHLDVYKRQFPHLTASQGQDLLLYLLHGRCKHPSHSLHSL